MNLASHGLDDPPRDHADLSGSFGQRSQGSGQKGAHAQPGIGRNTLKPSMPALLLPIP